MIWSGKRVAEYVQDVNKDMIQPNGIDLCIGEIFLLRPISERKKLKPNKYNLYLLNRFQPYIIRFKNKVVIPNKVVGMFFVRSTMWRARGIMIQPSLWDTGYVGHGEVLIFPTIDTFLLDGERFGQIVFADAEKTFQYRGQYQELVKSSNLNALLELWKRTKTIFNKDNIRRV
ncbi:MAG: hypothetical protein GWP09_00420 [Nitrospiraceae bacterium]|nr:hypothetical protein [Nitrospiraceae bacterium]